MDKILKRFFLILFLIFNLFVLFNYIGNKLVYASFSLLSLIYLLYMFRSKSIFFDKFMGLFLFLGLWFNFSLKIKLKSILPNGFGDFKYWFSDGVGSFDFSSSSIDKVLFLCIISYFAIMISSFIRQKFFVYKKNIISNFEKNFYLKNKSLILIFFFLIISIFSVTNFYFKIYQRGLVNDYNFFLNSLFTFLFFILFPSITTLIINYEFHTNKSLKISFFASIVESFLNSYSILSRNFIFNPISNLFGIYKLNNLDKKFSIKNIYFFFILILIFFLISVIVVSKERNEFVVKNIEESKIKIISDNKIVTEKNILIRSSERVLKIFISRLIGVEGIMAVSSSDLLSFKLFYSALNEKYERGENSFYDEFKNENRTMKDCKANNFKIENCNINSISLMGVIAFLFYSGSYLFLFFCLSIICLFCSFIEFISFKASNNMIFSAFVSQIFAYRLWHFGYIPSNSYKLVLSICFIIILIYLYRKLISKIKI